MVSSNSNSRLPPDDDVSRREAAKESTRKYKNKMSFKRAYRQKDPILAKLQKYMRQFQPDETQRGEQFLSDLYSQLLPSSSHHSNAANLQSNVDIDIESKSTYTSSNVFEVGCCSNNILESDLAYGGVSETGDQASSSSSADVTSSSSSGTGTKGSTRSEIENASGSLYETSDMEYLSEPEINVDSASVARNSFSSHLETGNTSKDFDDTVARDTVELSDLTYFIESGFDGDADSFAWGCFSSDLDTGTINDDDFEVVAIPKNFGLENLEYFSDPDIANAAASMTLDRFDSNSETSSINDNDFEDVNVLDPFLDAINAELFPETGGAGDAAFSAAGSGGSHLASSDNSSADFDTISEVDSVATFCEDDGNTIATEKHRSTMELYLLSKDFSAPGPLCGVYCGRFGTAEPQSILSYGPHHLCSWTTGRHPSRADFSDLFPDVIIKKAAPLSQNIIGITTDAKDLGDTSRDGELLLFNINRALNMPTKSYATIPLPFDSPHHKNISVIQDMHTEDERTFFLTSAKHSTEVVMHSYMQDANTLALPGTPRIMASMSSSVSALGYDREAKNIISGSVRGQVTVADAYTGKFIRGYSFDSDDASNGLGINHFAFCPSRPGILMASCSRLVKQLRVMDLRARHSNVLSFGAGLIDEYPEGMTPAWNPDNGQVVVPYNREHTGYRRNYLAIFDTRYINCNSDTITAMSLYNGETTSVAFGRDQDTGDSIMVTAGDSNHIGVGYYTSNADDHSIGHDYGYADRFRTDNNDNRYIVEEWGVGNNSYINHSRSIYEDGNDDDDDYDDDDNYSYSEY